MSKRRVQAVFRKELREYRRTGSIVWAMGILPLIFLLQPLAIVLKLQSTAAVALRHDHLLLYMLAIPALVPATLAAYSVVGEREQGTLEPVLTTPVRREEFLLGKALAALLPSLAVAYGVYALFIAYVEIFAKPGIATALLQGPQLLAQLLFTPLLATWSIWAGIAISTRSSEVRVAQQFGLLANLPSVLVTSLIAFDIIHPTWTIAIAGAALLIFLDVFGYRLGSSLFDRERLITGTRS